MNSSSKNFLLLIVWGVILGLILTNNVGTLYSFISDSIINISGGFINLFN